MLYYVSVFFSFHFFAKVEKRGEWNIYYGLKFNFILHVYMRCKFYAACKQEDVKKEKKEKKRGQTFSTSFHVERSVGWIGGRKREAGL